MEIAKAIELFKQREEERKRRILDFFEGKRNFLVVQSLSGNLDKSCNTIENMVKENLSVILRRLENNWTDDLPYLEPWFGVGVYANAFGCEYVWREGEPPTTHYKHKQINEIKNIEYPDWTKSPIMRMVLDGIDALKEKTEGKLPISLTDTQSPFDTATLILDAVEFFTSCYTDEETVLTFMEKITDLVIEFSKIQTDRIGQECIARPGHIMSSGTFLKGISISDDNLAVSSPLINEKIALPFNKKIAREFGGVAIHSCGVWSHTMKLLPKYKGIFMVDCAGDFSCDTRPNVPSEIRDSLKDTGIIVKVRIGNNKEKIKKALSELAAPGLRLIIDMVYSEENAENNYKNVYDQLNKIYK